MSNTLRKLIPSLLALATMTAPVLPALATTHETRRDQLQERAGRLEAQRQQRSVEERRQATTTRRREGEGRLGERRKDIIRAFAAKMVKRFEAALERERRLAERIQSRIDKARANGRDVTRAQAALDRARGMWQEAGTGLQEVKGKIESALGAENPRESFREVRRLLGALKDKIKAVHAALVDAITALKGIGGGERRGQSATSTP